MSKLNILCVDNSIHSRTAFDWYIGNYHREGDTVGLLHVYQSPSIPISGPLMNPLPLIDTYHNVIERSIQEIKLLKAKYKYLCEEKQIKCELMIIETDSSPGQTICQTAKEKYANGIVMGQRGLGTISRKLLGSVSDYVIHHASIPVTVVPTPKPN